VAATLWTAEPTVPSLVVEGNSIDVRSALEAPGVDRTDVHDHAFHGDEADNEIRSRRAGWVVWRAP
jgi:hypothetical protein